MSLSKRRFLRAEIFYRLNDLIDIEVNLILHKLYLIGYILPFFIL